MSASVVMLIHSEMSAETKDQQSHSQVANYNLSSGIYYGNPAGSGTALVYSHEVHIPGAKWMRLLFGEVSLGSRSYMTITALKDSSQQKLSAASLAEWKNTSAYFNGESVRVDLFLASSDTGVSFRINQVLTDEPNSSAAIMSICGTDDRTASTYPAVGRVIDLTYNIYASAWIAPSGVLVSAGHVVQYWTLHPNAVVEFNVPMSLSDGTVQHPAAKDQYTVSRYVAYQIAFAHNGDPIGEDWGTFEVANNSVTGLQPIEAQQAFFQIAQTHSATLRVIGCGVAPAEKNKTQQSADGSDAGSSGELLRYTVDTDVGCSGGPVIDVPTGRAVGVHDNDGCSSSGGSNAGTSMNNAGLWNALQPSSHSATVDQKLADNTTSVGTVGRWNGSTFPTIPLGGSIVVTTGSPEVLLGDQSSYSGQKYQYWKTDRGFQSDLTNPHKFYYLGTSFISQFEPVATNAAVQSYPAELGSAGFPVQFADPWLIDYPDPTYHVNRNEGMAAPPKTVQPTQNLGNAPYSGVFPNLSGPLQNWSPPYYSVSAPPVQSYSGANWSFVNWSGTAGTVFQNPTQTSTPMMFGGANSVVTANYKGIHLSNDGSAFTDNSQKKLVETADGVLHQVYTSSIAGVSHVWYETSTDQGATWRIMNYGQPLDGANGGKCPSIAVNNSLQNQGGYAVAIAFQQQGAQGGQSGSTFTIQVMNFFQNLYSYNLINIWITLFSEPMDPYATTNANPNISWVAIGGNFLVAWERKNAYQTLHAGINYEFGFLNFVPQQSPCNFFCYTNNGGSPHWITGTDANSVNASISCNGNTNSWGGFAFHAAWEEDVNSLTSHINWCILGEYWGPNGEDIGQGTPNGADFYNITQSSYYVLNVRPSVIALADTNARVWWTGDKGGGVYYSVNAVGCDPYTHSSFTFEGAAVRSVSTNSAGNTPTYYIAYSQNYPPPNWLNVATCSSATYSIRTLNTTGRDIQLCNGATTTNMYVSSYYPFSAPYYFKTSQNLSAVGLNKETSLQEFYLRGLSLKKAALEFSYIFGNLVVDGNIIDFVDAPDSTDYGALSSVNKVFETKPFGITSKSTVTFTENAGFADSTAAAQVLGTTGYVGYKVDLVDNATNAVIGTIRNTTMKSLNVPVSNLILYSLNTSVVKSNTVKVRITHSTNLDSVKTALMKGYSPVNMAGGLAKSLTQEIAIIGSDIPTSFALDQNYPNPFNPSTTIRFGLPSAGNVSLIIYDVLGREVTTLVKGTLNAGYHTATWNASSVASGVYFARLTVTNEFGKVAFNKVTKLLLMK